jgi:hypothetical protein
VQLRVGQCAYLTLRLARELAGADVLLRYGRTVWRLLRRDEAALASAGRENGGNALVDWLGSP